MAPTTDVIPSSECSTTPPLLTSESVLLGCVCIFLSLLRDFALAPAPARTVALAPALAFTLAPDPLAPPALLLSRPTANQALKGGDERGG